MPATYRMTMTKYELMQHLFRTSSEPILLPDGLRAFVQSVQREDGSGKSFNLTVYVTNLRETVGVYCTTTD